MKYKEKPETMVDFLKIITGRTPHVRIEGPSRAFVSVTRKTAQELFKGSRLHGYAVTVKFDDIENAAIVEVVNG